MDIDKILLIAIGVGVVLIIGGLLLGIFVYSKSFEKAKTVPQPAQGSLPYHYWPYFVGLFIIGIIILILFKYVFLK